MEFAAMDYAFVGDTHVEIRYVHKYMGNTSYTVRDFTGRSWDVDANQVHIMSLTDRVTRIESILNITE